MKKYREITIDGEDWAWMVSEKDSYYKLKTIKIWREKKSVYEKTIEKEYPITPGLIARFSKLYLKK